MEQHGARGFEWAVDGTPVPLRRVLPQRLGRRPGRLHVRRGRVWVTRSNDLDDHVLGPGESIAIDDPRVVVVEPWDAAAAALVTWQPQARVAAWLASVEGVAAGASARLVASSLAMVTRGIERLERLRARLERLRGGAAAGCAGTVAAPTATIR
ncbi:DUF2917 domain-containing protein [Piscinibacter koreensis]|uniref:DUF2917 domain-containing protein n=1 Tax=Piscinibacter koreensis TaxID=2742824 RepID=A0A7Y6TWV4_9BURK|nr:DUF2917 domain-containing protein [Schlegelella koreensis]NUZ06470.1 DUF2917 domain-containing protein [Schlegelella koreensis]